MQEAETFITTLTTGKGKLCVNNNRSRLEDFPVSIQRPLLNDKINVS